MIKWRVEPLALLKENGYSTYKLRTAKYFSESTIQKMRHSLMISTTELDTVCRLTGKQPGKLIEWVKDPEDDNNQE